MKRVVVTTLALAIACSGLAVAQSFGPAGSGQHAIKFAPCVLGPDDITQSVDCGIELFTGIACAAGGITTDTGYPRRFFLNTDHAITGAYTVDALQFGVEVDVPGASGPCAGNPITVKCHSIAAGAAFTLANLNELASVDIDLAGTAAGTIVTVPINCTINDPVAEDLVMEYISCDHNDAGDGGQFFPGANSLGETQPSYIYADDCGIFDPIALDDIGFPANDNVVVVEGTEGGTGCQGYISGEPRVRRRASGVTIDFRLDLTHRRDLVNVPIYAELQDLAGNVVAEKTVGLYAIGLGETISVRDKMKAPSSIPAGEYILAVKIPRMKNLLEFKKLIVIP